MVHDGVLGEFHHRLRRADLLDERCSIDSPCDEHDAGQRATIGSARSTSHGYTIPYCSPSGYSTPMADAPAAKPIGR